MNDFSTSGFEQAIMDGKAQSLCLKAATENHLHSNIFQCTQTCEEACCYLFCRTAERIDVCAAPLKSFHIFIGD